MVAFEKVKYPEYKINKSTIIPLFSSRKFLQWEASCEIMCSYDEAEHLDALYNKDDKTMESRIALSYDRLENLLLLALKPFDFPIQYHSLEGTQILTQTIT
jgi:hypothetical protein